MEVRESHVAFLSNAEVYGIIKEQFAASDPAYRTVQLEVTKYFDNPARLTKFQTLENSRELLNRLKHIAPDLTELELLTIVNLLPKSPVELHPIVDEAYNRWSEEVQGQILTVIQQYTPSNDGTSEPVGLPASEPPAPIMALDEDDGMIDHYAMDEDDEDDLLVDVLPSGESGLGGGRAREFRELDED